MVWTLQKLLAPQKVLFYTQNWTLYKDPACANHKADVAVLEELEGATGMDSRFLTNFSPGMDDARSRLQWASLRCTTRPEGIAYSLFGILTSICPFCTANLLRRHLAVSWPKSCRSLGTYRCWIGWEGCHRFTPAFLPTSPHIKRYHCLHPNLMQRNSHRRQVSSPRRP